ncbi:nucleoside triphosphate pyrophosphohydrolase family protein [Draconibacterium sp.]|nr:nucleoside triphosphate pyrophosphohydrolase family protein [Draconibacterium sp.]
MTIGVTMDIQKHIDALPEDLRSDFIDYVGSIAKQVAKGRAAHGEASLDRSNANLCDEQREEIADVAGWGFVLYRRETAARAQMVGAPFGAGACQRAADRLTTRFEVVDVDGSTVDASTLRVELEQHFGGPSPTIFDAVAEFHAIYQHRAPEVPSFDYNDARLRRELVREEKRELDTAMQEASAAIEANDKWALFCAKVAMLDALADILYVAVGFAVSQGWDIAEAVRRVHRSNLTKLGADGKPIYNDAGKVQKGPNYQAPELADLVVEAGE